VLGEEHASLESLNQHLGGLTWFILRQLPDKSSEYSGLIVSAVNLIFYES
jgi:hypothetical protein